MRILIPVLLAALLFSGCTGTDPDSDPVADLDSEEGVGGVPVGEEPNIEPQEPKSSSTDPHGTPQVTESPVTTRLGNDGSWHAYQTVTIVNGVGDLTRTDIDYAASSGHVNVVGSTRGGYEVLVSLDARGDTEDAARENLDRAEVNHEDRTSGDLLVLSTDVEAVRTPGPIPLLPDLMVGAQFVVYSFDVAIPNHMAHDITAAASSGQVTVTNVRGPSIDVEASSGRVSVTNVQATNVNAVASSGDIDVTRCVASTLSASASSGRVGVSACRVTGSLKATASSGRIALEAEVSNVEADASSGKIDAELDPIASGGFRFTASSGSIDVRLGTGSYDAEGSVSSGRVNIDLADGQPVGEQTEEYAHVRSSGFDGAAIQTTIMASASSGSIDIEG